MHYINQFLSPIVKQFREIYLKSNLYDKKISKVRAINFNYKPSAYLFSSLINYQIKKYKIENFTLDSVWENNNISLKDFKKLNSFFWFFSLDLKSSNKTTQSLISNWIKNNNTYNSKSWNFDLTSKRIIAWLSNSNLTYDESDQNYRNKFNTMVQKQANHLIHQITNSNSIDDKLISSAAIILVGLCYQEQRTYLTFGLDLLKKISKISLDTNGFPKSRSIKQSIFYLKYFILIREWLKEAQNNIPEFIDEAIYYLGQSYAFIKQGINKDILFNGNNLSKNDNFEQYLKRFGYKFKNENNEIAGYAILRNKKISLIMDIGSSPNKKFSKDYQSGALSFEIISNGKKLISNSGYYQGDNLKLNWLSKSTATHSTLTINDHSSCGFEKIDHQNFILKNGLKITKKNITFEKSYWKINSAHDGYFKKFDSIHERQIEFYPELSKFIGVDKIINQKFKNNIKFDLRFHFEPNIKIMKTQDNKSILIDLNDEGWKFTCDNYDINIDKGLYFGNKNSYIENQNIFISDIMKNPNENIKWELIKI